MYAQVQPPSAVASVHLGTIQDFRDCCSPAGSLSAPQLHKVSPEPAFQGSPRMRQGMASRQKYLQHVALAFVAGGVLTYICVNLMGHAGRIDAKGDLSARI